MEQGDLAQLMHALLPAARAAGEITLAVRRDGAGAMRKADGSLVTEADRAAEELIVREIARLAPGIPVVGEEGVEAGRVPDISGGRFFLVDPLDGTREYVAGGNDFTVNIGFLQGFRPVLGIILAPVSGDIYYGAAGEAFLERGGEKKRIVARAPPAEGFAVVTGKRGRDLDKTRAWLGARKIASITQRSSTIKSCLIAEGVADVFPRLGPTYEWDTAAAEALVRAAGGRFETLDGKLLSYGKVSEGFLNPPVIVSGKTGGG